MTNEEEWFKLWGRLCRRFNRTVDAEEASDYLGYLEAIGLDMAQIRRAVESAWATREFFPRPADFLAGESALGWTAIREMASKMGPTMSSEDARIYMAAIPERSMRAIRSLGGMDVLHTTRDFPRLRREYMDAFERTLVEDTTLGVKMLSAPSEPQLQPRRQSSPASVGSLVGGVLAGIETLASPD